MKRQGKRQRSVDRELSRAYRDLAHERTPATLNEAIIRQARGKSGRGYARAMHWLRPLGWASTVGLCLVVILELTMVEGPATRDLAVPDARQSADPSATASPGARRVPDGQQTPAPGRTRESLMREKQSAAPRAAAPAGNQKIAGAGFCGAEEVATPEAWLECIQRLEAEDRMQAAAGERERLTAAFPDFRLPDD
jgi:hypothetical protein